MNQKSPSNKLTFTRVRVFFIVLLFILVLFFHGDAIIQTVLALLGIGTFEPIFNPILSSCEQWIMKPLERFWHFLFRNHLTSLGNGRTPLTGEIGGKA
jgi:hypothetical protein